jgi:hypothetical protein
MQAPQKMPTARKAKRAAAKRHGKLRRAEASQYLWEVHGVKYAPATLAKYACRGTGPIFRYLGRIPIYGPKDLDEWVRPSLGEPRRHTRKHRERASFDQSDLAPANPNPSSVSGGIDA